MARPAGAPVLTVNGLTKRYPGVTALDHIALDLVGGEIHALVGENGAGKSTLVKCLVGVEQPDTGEMRLAGEPYRPSGPADALAAGVRVVHQELSLVPTLTVAENLCLERMPRTAGVVDRAAMRRRAVQALGRLGLAIRPDTSVASLGIAQVQLVEIARAVGTGRCQLLVLDEPTATLTSREVETLFTVLRQLRHDGVSIVYISHHLTEIFEIGDRVTVLRNGRRVESTPISGVDSARLIQLMVGRDMAAEFPPVTPRPRGEVLLSATNLRVTPASPPVTLSVHAGEVVGVAGLVGSGRTEAMRAIFGADRPASGTVEFRGRELKAGSPRAAVEHGISFLTEDRKAQGLVLDSSIAVNVTLASLRGVSRGGLLRRRTETRTARDIMRRLRIRAVGPQQIVRTLSGGNQQKAVLGRWLVAATDLLIVDEPTRGIDVGARYEIHQLLLELAAGGKGVLVVSSDLPELLGICDRLIIFSRGRIAGEMQRADFDAERVLRLAYADYLEDREST